MQYEADLPHESERPPVETPVRDDVIDLGAEQAADTLAESSVDAQETQEVEGRSVEEEAHLETVQRTMGRLALGKLGMKILSHPIVALSATGWGLNMVANAANPNPLNTTMAVASAVVGGVWAAQVAKEHLDEAELKEVAESTPQGPVPPPPLETRGQ